MTFSASSNRLPRSAGFRLKKLTVVAGGQVRTIGGLVEFLEAPVSNCSIWNFGLVYGDVVLEEDDFFADLP